MKFFQSKIFKVGAFCISIVISLSNYLWGVWLPDNFYWMALADRWQDSYMCVLSMWGMHEWAEMFGNTLLADRMLAWLLNILTVFIPYFALINKKDWLTYIYYLCGALVIMGPGISKCCTPDCFTSITGVLLIAATVKMLSVSDNGLNKQCQNLLLKSKRICIWILLISIITAVSIAVRFPNILFLPLIMLYIVLSDGDRKKNCIVVFLYLICTIVFYCLLLNILFESDNGLQIVLGSASDATSESNGRHSLLGLTLRYGKSVLLSIIALACFLFAWWISHKSIIKNNVVRCLIAVGISIVLIYEIMNHIGEGFHSWSVCLVSLVSVLFGYYAYKEKKNRNVKHVYYYLFLLLMPFIPSAGSDTGFQKSIMMACALAPIAFMYTERYFTKKFYLNTFYTSAMFVSLLIFSKGLVSVNSRATDGVLKGVWFADWEIKGYDEVVESCKPFYKKDHTIFYGFLKGHYLYCYYGTKALYNVPFWMEQNDVQSIGAAIKGLDNNKENVLIDFTDSNEDIFTSRGLTKVGENKNVNVYKYQYSITLMKK